MSHGLHGKTPLTEDNLLTEPLAELDFGPFTHPGVTYDKVWFDRMIKHLDESIKEFRERRILIISWVLAILFGIFGNLFASALFGRFEYSSWGFAFAFFIAACASASLLFWFFPPEFKHSFQVWFGEEATVGEHKLVEKFGVLDNHDRLEDFFRIYHSLMIRDCLKEHQLRLTKVTDVEIPEYGYETWVKVRLGSTSTAWLRKSVEKQLLDELGPLCEAFATTTLPFCWIDESTPKEQVKAFDLALANIRFENVRAKLRRQILEA